MLIPSKDSELIAHTVWDVGERDSRKLLLETHALSPILPNYDDFMWIDYWVSSLRSLRGVTALVPQTWTNSSLVHSEQYL